MIRCLLLAAFLYALPACTPASQPATPLSPFFDLTGFFEEELDRLPGIGTVTKSTTINGVTDTQRTAALDYRTELAPFLSADINRPAWLDKYRADSLHQDGVLRRLTYTALDDDLFTRELFVSFDGPAVDSIRIVKGSELMIADTRRELLYVPRSGYSIRGAQRVLLASDNRIAIEVEF